MAALILFMIGGWGAPVQAQSTINYAVQLYSQTTESPPTVTLMWATDATATRYDVYRRPLGGTWTALSNGMAGSATSYVDTNVTLGVGVEYRVLKAPYNVNGYLYGGIRMPEVENRGKILLIVDNTYAADLTNELARLQLDLAGDGWTVLRHDVSRSDSVTNVKAIIAADYLADSNAVKSVFLFGHVPVPFSGNMAPDGHDNHIGAWPADGFYADLDGLWTDSTVSNTSAGRLRNIPGDGKYDQSYLPSRVELAVGRVDLANLPAFAQSERELLRQYLNKAHNFRHQYFVANPRGLVDDNFGVFYGEAFAACGWQDFALFFTPANVSAKKFATELVNNRYLWAYGCGPGSYTSAGGVDTTAGLASGLRQAVFTMLFGSYHGDWDTTDNFMRAALASTPSILTCDWAGRPHWFHHLMGLGQPIGACVQALQNSRGGVNDYPGFYGSGCQVALMGDPTLRLLPVPPPANLNASLSGSDAALAWKPSADAAVLGYHVYRADVPDTAFGRLNATLVTATNFLDTTVRTNAVRYMVRAVKLEQTPSGSYTNLSQGVFNRLTLAGSANHPPVVTNRVFVTDEDTAVSIPLGGTDADGDPLWFGLNVFPNSGRLTGAPTNYVYLPPTNFFGTNTFVYYAGDGMTDSGTAVVSIVVNPINDAPIASNQTVLATNNQPAAIRLRGGDVEGSPLTYTLVTTPTHGTLTGTLPDVVYTATNYPYGADALTFTAFDGERYGNTGTVSITVIDPPTALPDTVTTPEDTPVVISVLTNDFDPNGDTLSVSAVTAAARGTVSNQGVTVTYTPSNNYAGVDTFGYTASDGHSGTATALVSVTVSPVNDAPQAQDQSVRVLSDSTNRITLVAVDPESDPISYSIVTSPTNGALTGVDGGSNVVYSPSAGAIGPDSFRFRSSDGASSSTGTVAITIIYAFPAAAVSHLEPGLDYQYYEGPFTNVPDVNLLMPVKQDASPNGFDVGLRERETNFAFRFSGYVSIPESGEYQFYVGAEHGANLSIWDTPLVTYSDSGDAEQWDMSERIAMRAGYHPITVVYFKHQTLDAPFLNIYMAGASGGFRLMGTSVLARVSSRPWAALTSTSATGGVPLAVTFDGTGSYDTNGSIVSYQWDFGDGTTATGAVVTHSYALTGPYTATLTVTDNDGGRDTIAVPVTVNYQPNALTYAESFEDYATGATMAGRRGWRLTTPDDARVTNLDYTAHYTGSATPLNTRAHTKILVFEAGVTNEITGGTNRIVTVECMLNAHPVEEFAPVASDNQLGCAVGTNRHVYVLHGQPGVTTGVWSEASGATVGTADWVRVTLRLDYQTPDTTYGHRYGRVWVNGSPLLSTNAYTTNNGAGMRGGPWFAMVDASRPYFSGIRFNGSGMLDDLLATDIVPDSVTTNGTLIRWLMDNIGITNDYDALAAEDADGDGSPNWAERIAGTEPLDSNSFFRVLSTSIEAGTNWIVWYGTTNGGVSSPFAVERSTNITASWDMAVSNLDRSASGTNTWGDGTAPAGAPVFYRPLILP